ncbi:hypothetical protein L596_023437 [Steinernema carpocapsae]|uniref:Uncharacterized protein n=1 Tax=Steinernema carpocapsae TaxID=34508 RepID=A0A4V5ZZE7_STECR|nr:hypothetical protein L596_023437 [Steinernema carpocapsae]
MFRVWLCLAYVCVAYIPDSWRFLVVVRVVVRVVASLSFAYVLASDCCVRVRLILAGFCDHWIPWFARFLSHFHGRFLIPFLPISEYAMDGNVTQERASTPPDPSWEDRSRFPEACRWRHVSRKEIIAYRWSTGVLQYRSDSFIKPEEYGYGIYGQERSEDEPPKREEMRGRPDREAISDAKLRVFFASLQTPPKPEAHTKVQKMEHEEAEDKKPVKEKKLTAIKKEEPTYEEADQTTMSEAGSDMSQYGRIRKKKRMFSPWEL